jgi:hypothetical protein
VPKSDPEVDEWVSKNGWFNTNKRMKSVAYTIHDELIAEGIDPGIDSKEYYRKLDAEMRNSFPTYDWKDSQPKKPRSVVASVTRSPKQATRVVLTQSQVAVARRMGITPLQYATELAKLEAQS